MEHKLRDSIHAMFLITRICLLTGMLCSARLYLIPSITGRVEAMMGFGFTNFAAASWPLSLEVGSYKCMYTVMVGYVLWGLIRELANGRGHLLWWKR